MRPSVRLPGPVTWSRSLPASPLLPPRSTSGESTTFHPAPAAQAWPRFSTMRMPALSRELIAPPRPSTPPRHPTQADRPTAASATVVALSIPRLRSERAQPDRRHHVADGVKRSGGDDRTRAVLDAAERLVELRHQLPRRVSGRTVRILEPAPQPLEVPAAAL